MIGLFDLGCNIKLMLAKSEETEQEAVEGEFTIQRAENPDRWE